MLKIYGGIAMSKVLATVNGISGKFFAMSPTGEVRVLNSGDVVYEGDAIFSQVADGSFEDFIDFVYTNGENVVLTGSSYYLVETIIAGNDDTDIQRSYPSQEQEEYIRLHGYAEGEDEDSYYNNNPDSASFIPNTIRPENTNPAPEEDPSAEGTAPDTDVDVIGADTAQDIPNAEPEAPGSEITGIEDTEYVITLADLNYSDADGDPAFAVKIISLPDEGTLTLNGNPVVEGQVIHASDIDGGLLVFTPDADEYGSGYTEFLYAVSDGEAYSNPGTMIVNIDPVDTGIDNQTYTENDPATILDSEISLTDVAGDYVSGATVTITDLQDGDVLSFTQQSGITGSYNAATGVLTLTGTATVAEYEAALESVTYISQSDDPTVNDAFTTRDIEWSVTGAENTTHYGSLLTIIPLTDNPVVMSDSVTMYTEGEPAVVIDHAVSLSDVDDTEITSATVQITEGLNTGDVLSFIDTANISGSYDPETGTLTLTGTASVAEYEAALQSVTYENTGDDLSDDKTITWTVNDANSDDAGTGTGIATSTIVAIPLPDSPVFADIDDQVYTENDPATVLDSDISLTDVDDEYISGASITITDLQDGDVLSFTEQSGITGSYDPVTGVLTLTGTATVAEYESALESVTYLSESDDPTVGDTEMTRDIKWSVTDADSDGTGAQTTTYTSLLTITPVENDDAPIANQAADVTVTEADYDAVADVTVNGNLLTDGGADNFNDGFDYVPDNGAVIYQVSYTDTNGDAQTTTLTTTETTLDTYYGSLTINKDTGAYAFDISGNIDHTASDSVTETFSYNLIDGDGDISNFADQNIIITDGTDPSFGTVDSAVLYEKNLASGTDPDAGKLSVTGSLDLTGGSDDFEAVFTQNTIDYLESLNLESNNSTVTYSLSPDGSTITAEKDDLSGVVFTVVLTSSDSDSAGYTFTLSAPIDESGDKVMNLPVSVTDSDDDTATATISLTIMDDTAPTEQTISVNEDSNATVNTNADVTQVNTVIGTGAVAGDIAPTHGTAVVNPDGSITYTATDQNYSGTDSFTYTTTTDQGEFTTTVTVNVIPVSDAPTWSGTTDYTTLEDTSVPLSGMALPVLSDTDTDQYSEKLGTINVDISTGAALEYSYTEPGGNIVSGNSITGTSSTADMHIVIVNGDGTVNTDYHYSDIDTTGAVLMTVAQYQSMVYTPTPDDADDADITITATSYDSTDGTMASAVAGASSTSTVHVEVEAITDPVTMAASAASDSLTASEDSWINIGSYFTWTTGDFDGSEDKSITISGIPSGWSYSVNGTSVKGTANGSDITISVNNSFYIKPPLNSDADANFTVTFTVESTDTDDDTTVFTTPIITETASDSITLDITIDPQPDGVTINTTDGQNYEDSLVSFDVSATIKDTSVDDGSAETIDTVTISNIPTGAIIYTDAAGTVVLVDNTTGANSSVVITVNSTSDYSDTFYILPPQDYNGSFDLDIDVESYESADAGNSVTDSGTVTIDVVGVVDTSAGDADHADAGYLDVSIGGSAGTGVSSTASYLATYATDEDVRVNLNIDVDSFESSGDGSEKITVVISMDDGSYSGEFTIVDNGGNEIGYASHDGWHLTAAEAADAHLLPAEDSGDDLSLAVTTIVEDKDGSTVDDVNTQTEYIYIDVTPVTDVPDIVVRDVFTNEDSAVNLDIRPIVTDIDGSESPISVSLTVPSGAALSYYDSGSDSYITIFVNDTAGELTYDFSIDAVSTGTTGLASGAGGTYASGITLENLGNLYFTPPAHANGDIELTVTPVVQEDTGEVPASQTVTVTVYSQGIADAPVLHLVDTDDSSVILNQGTGEESTLNPSQDVIYDGDDTITIVGHEKTENNPIVGIPISLYAVSSEYTASVDISTNPAYSAAADPMTDTSETISYILDNVPDDIRLVDSAGNLVGTYMGAGGDSDTKKWAITADEMSDLLLSAPEKYSGVFELILTTIVTEDDGDETSIQTPITLDIQPEITTTADDVLVGATGSEDGLMILSFGSSDDTSEVLTYVKIPESGIPEGFTLMIYDEGSSQWVAASSFLTPEGGYYVVTDYYQSGYVALQVNDGGVWSQKDTATEGVNPQITGIIVGIDDLTDGDSTETDAALTGDMDVIIDADADAPAMSVADDTLEPDCGVAIGLGITASYDDSDGSETHYYIIQSVPNGWYVTNAEYNGDGTWYVEAGDISNVSIVAYGNDPADITVVGYSVETSNEDTETSSIVINVDPVDGTCSGPGTETYTAQVPTLVVVTPTTTEDTASLSLDDFITSLHLNDSDSGSESLVLIISDLPAGVTLSSDTYDLINYTDSTGKDCIRVEIPTNGNDEVDPAVLQAIMVNLPSDYSGMITFTLNAVAIETGNGTRIVSAGTDQENNVSASISPVADALVVMPIVTSIVEDQQTALQFTLSSSDGVTSSVDHAETVSSTVYITITNGTFVDGSGNTLASTNLEVQVDGSGNVTFGGSVVYVVPNSQTTDTVTISISADVTDATDGYVSSVITQSTSYEISVSSEPDPAGYEDGSNTPSTLAVLDASGAEDAPIQLNITAVFPDADGSEIQSLVLTDMPDGAIIVNSLGNIVGQNNGNGTWDITGADLGDIYFVPSPNFSGTLTLGITSYAIEIDTFDAAEYSTTFDVEVTAVADGVVITTHNASGAEGDYIRPAGDTGFLEGALVETEEYLLSTYYDANTPDESRMDETYKVVFDGVDDGISFYYQDAGGNYILLQDTDAGADTYTMEGLTQSQLDTLSIVSTETTGTLYLGVEVSSQEYDSDGNLVDTSAPETGSLTVSVSAVTQGLELTDFGRGAAGAPADLTLSYIDGDGSESISGNIVITTTASLNHGSESSDVWTLSESDLTGLTFTPADNAAFTTTIEATTTENGVDNIQTITISHGSSSNDSFNYGDADYIDGWGGTDTVSMSGQTINLELVSSNMTGIEKINMDNGTSTNAITNLSVNDFLDITGGGNTLTIDGGSEDSVSLVNGDGGDWTDNGVSGGYHSFSYSDGGSTHTINIDVDINTTVS